MYISINCILLVSEKVVIYMTEFKTIIQSSSVFLFLGIAAYLLNTKLITSPRIKKLFTTLFIILGITTI